MDLNSSEFGEDIYDNIFCHKNHIDRACKYIDKLDLSKIMEIFLICEVFTNKI